MSGIAIKLDMDAFLAEATDTVRIFVEGLRSRAGLHEAIGRQALARTRDHLINIAGTRHATAERLGATPSGHWAQAAEKTTMTSSGQSASISINHPGIGRVAHDVEILPTRGLYLTIPLIAGAYNQRARRVKGLFFVKPEGADHALLGKRDGEGVEWWYLLVTSVRQRQDRTLLPSDEEYQQALRDGVLNYAEYLVSLAGGRDSKRGFREYLGGSN